MAQKRISILVALDGSDEGLKRALSSAERSLGELSGTAKTAAARASSALAQVKVGVSAFGDQIGQARTQLLAFVSINWAAGKAREVIQVADAWNMMTARLKLATAGQRELVTAQKEVFDIAQRIGVPVQETATLYGKLQQAVRMLGGEQKDALSLTESISQALRISGASATEAQSSLLQFGQALASGVLRGEEFNSVVENSPRLAQALADGLNVPIGRLRKLAEEGRLTADVVVNALASQKDRLASEYAQLPQTVSQAFQRVRNAFSLWIAKLDESTGMTQKLAQALTWLAENMDALMQWLKRIAEVGLAVLVYRLIPALVTAWQVAGAAGVAAATSTAAAWTTANLSITAAATRIGLLGIAFTVLGALLVGWQIGTWLSEKFEIVRKAGILMVEVLMRAIEELRYRWEVFAAVFSSDTISQATQRHQARVAEMRQIFADMYADAAQAGDAAKTVMNTAAGTAEEIARRLEAVRQGTQESVGRGVEVVHAAVEKLKSRLGEVEQTIGRTNRAVQDSTARMAEAYNGITALVDAYVQRQVEIIKARYQQETAELALSHASQAAALAKSTQLLIDTLTQQTALRRRSSTETLQLIDGEAQARLEAARRQGQTDEERRTNTLRVENEILAAKRQTLASALDEYRQHVDALNAEANRHLAEVQRIEGEKRQLSQTTEERIRDIRRQGMSDFEALEDRKQQIEQYQAQARQALAQGEFDQAQQLAKKAMDLAAQVASSQSSEAQRAQAARQQAEQGASQAAQLEAQARQATRQQEYAQAESLMRQAEQLRSEMARKSLEADAASSKGKDAVNRAIQDIRESQDILNRALDAESSAHQKAAQSAASARGQIQQSLKETENQVDQITAKLQQGFKFSIDADTTHLQQALDELDKAWSEKERLLVIKADLEQAQRKLQEYEQLLKEGHMLPVGADVSQAKSALDSLKVYATDTSQLELKVATEKAQAAITNVAGQIEALANIHTESMHSVSTNAQAAKTEVMSLDGMRTRSEHVIHVRKVEEHATGGLIGAGIRKFASGGAVSAGFTRMSGGQVPGSGHHDTVPRTLESGAFVIRKAAVRKYGGDVLSRLAGMAGASGRALLPQVAASMAAVKGYSRGGSVSTSFEPSKPEDAAGPVLPKRNRDAVEAQKMIDLGLQGMREYLHWLQSQHGGGVTVDMGWRTMSDYGKRAQQDRRVLDGLMNRKELTGNERAQLDAIRQNWRQAMAQPMSWGKDLERDLMDYMEQNQGQFYAGGGLSKTDTVPAMLTPGEYVVNKAAVARFGAGFFSAINSLSLSPKALAQKVQGFASGGFVQPLAGLAARASKAARSLPRGDLGAMVADSLNLPIRHSAPVYAGSTAGPAPGKTIRVELASGERKVLASVDARDEARLLDLLKQAQSRAR